MDNKTTKLLQLGRKIFAKRRESGYSQNKFAEMLNISREHLAKIETAKRCISLGLLIDVAECLNVQVKDLIDF